jgi:UDP-glucuronate 4-epimerase
MVSLSSHTIMVTGAAGFIGSHTVTKLVALGHSVIGVDNLNDYYNPEWKRENLQPLLDEPNFTFFETDVLDSKKMDEIFAQHQPQIVIHLAARAGVLRSLEQPELYAEVNVLGTTRMLEISKKYKVSKFIFASSSSVYGNQTKLPFSETDPCNEPVSPYAATKKSGEMMCNSYSLTSEMNIVCLRFFTVYGPSGRPDMAPYLFTEALLSDQPITQYGDGSTKRDYTYIDDIVNGIVSCLELKSKFEVINLGNNQPVSLKDFISTLEKITGKKANLVFKEMPAGDVNQTWADITKAQRLLQYQPQTSLEDGLQKFVEWYLKHRK